MSRKGADADDVGIVRIRYENRGLSGNNSVGNHRWTQIEKSQCYEEQVVPGTASCAFQTMW